MKPSPQVPFRHFYEMFETFLSFPIRRGSLWFYPGAVDTPSLFALRYAEAAGAQKIFGWPYNCPTHDDTLEVLRILDEAVRHHPEVMFYQWLWTRWPAEAKLGAPRAARLEPGWNVMTVPLYERRMIEQRRILKGEIKRGHRAFGFYPLEGRT